MQQILLDSEVVLKRGLQELAAIDEDLDRIIQEDGVPPLWRRTPDFATLVLIILEQQVSLASARAAYDRLVAHVQTLTPASFLKLDDETLRGVGFSRQKTRYVRGLSESILNGKLDLELLQRQTDEEASRQLIQIKGIGRWTADVYLLMALGRCDIWPVGDLALIKSVMQVKRLPTKPSSDEMEALAMPWRPWRSVAAMALWNHYLIHLNRRSVTN